MPCESCEQIKESSADMTSGVTDGFALWHKAYSYIFKYQLEIYFVACAQTLEFNILSSKEYNILKCLSAGYDCLCWPMVLACLDHLHLKFASTKFRSKNAPLDKNAVLLLFHSSSVKYKECSWEPYLGTVHAKTTRDKSRIHLVKYFRFGFLY